MLQLFSSTHKAFLHLLHPLTISFADLLTAAWRNTYFISTTADEQSNWDGHYNRHMDGDVPDKYLQGPGSI